MPENNIFVDEIVRRIEDCATRPFLCRCDDGNLYVVKGWPRVPNNQLIAEWVAANLAKKLNLSIPDFSLVYVSAELTEYVPDWRNDLGEGYAFGMQYVEGVSPLTYQQAHNNVGIQSQKDIYLFDRWIVNADRTLTQMGGNVNIIFDYLKNTHYLIDHNLAFDHHPGDVFDYHVYSPDNRTWRYDIVDKLEGQDKVSDFQATFEAAVSAIPEDWTTDATTEFVELMRNLLLRGRDAQFWSDLT